MRKLYKVKPEDVEEINYINVSSQTASKIGRRLAYTATFNPVMTLIGKISCLRTAMDYILIPDYPKKFISKNKLSPKDIAKIPKGKKASVINYWSIVIHLAYSRIIGDKTLLKDLLELDRDIKFTSFNISKFSSCGLESTVTDYNTSATSYVSIINDVYNIIRNNDKSKWDDLILDLIKESKVDKNKSMFDGVPFEIEIKDI